MTRVDAKQLARLAQLAAMQRDAALARMAAPLRTEAEARAALARIDRPSLPMDGGQGAWAAHLAYAAWGDQRARALNTRIAQARAETEAARPAAVAALGRAQILSRLSQRVGAGTGNLK